MAIQWGAWEYGSSSAGFRVGVESSVSAVSSGSSSVTMTTKWYVEAMYNVDDSMTVTFGGSISGTSTQNLTTGGSGGYKLWATKTYVYNYSTYGSSPGTRTFSGSLSGVYNGATPTKSVTLTIPARPNASPAAPSGVTATRTSDTRATVAWTRNATTAAPYSSVTVQRGLWNSALLGWGGWVTVATASSTATSIVDTGVVANNQYRYQIRANNGAGSSAFVAPASPVKMTPAAPDNAKAVLQPSGTAIALTWDNNHYADTNITLTIQRSVAGGAYANVVTGLAYTTSTWTDNTPGAGTNSYQIFAVQSIGSLSSAGAVTNTVSTTVPPLAPTNLQPNGTAVDWTLPQTITWQHNPGGDQAAQGAFFVESSGNGGSTWAEVNVNGTSSTVSAYTIPANTFTNGTTRLFRVRTRGVVAAGVGPYSASASIVGSATPVTTITGPATPILTLPATATWTYAQANGSPQVAWQLELLNGTQVVQSILDGETALSKVLNSSLIQQGATYTLRVRTQSAAGLWSAWATRALTVNLLPPAHVTVDADYQHATGTTVLSLTAAATQAGEVAVTSATVARRVPGGDWVTLVTDVALPNDVVDPMPATNGLNEYRITAKSATPTYRDEAIVEVAPPNPLTADDSHDRQWVFLSYGDAFTRILRLRSNAEVSVTAGREKAGQQFLGRAKPVAAMGSARSRVVNVKGDLVHDVTGGRGDEYLWDSPPSEWEDAGLDAEVVCLRDFTGRRIFGLLSDIATTDVRPGMGNVSFSVTEVEWVEVYG